MKPAPLQLIDYWATSIRMEACPNYNPKAKADLDFDSIEVKHTVSILDRQDPNEKGTHWLVGLSIEQTPCETANIPYTYEVSLQGVVLVLPGIPDDRIERAVRANGPAMLFGSAREMIRAATGRGPHSAIIIPSTNFLPTTTVVEEVATPATRIPVKKTVAKKAARKKP